MIESHPVGRPLLGSSPVTDLTDIPPPADPLRQDRHADPAVTAWQALVSAGLLGAAIRPDARQQAIVDADTALFAATRCRRRLEARA